MSVINLSTEVTTYLGKNIKDICPNSFINNGDNHCAHFVSHVMGYSFGFRCKGMTGKGTGVGASIRVNEVFAQCPRVGLWADKPAGDCLIFITSTDNVNVDSKVMGTRPKKHIGIFCNNNVYHYSNSKDKVITQTAEEFALHYIGSSFQLYYGTFPL